MERLAHPFEILMIDRLRLRREMDGSVRRSHRPCPEMDATVILVLSYDFLSPD